MRGIILIEALWPTRSGQSVIDLLPAQAATALQQKSMQPGDGWRIPPPPVTQFAINDIKLAKHVQNQLVDQPLATFEQPLYWKDSTTPHVYLIASDRDPQPYQDTASLLEQQGCEIKTMKGGHNLMLTNTTLVFETIIRTTSPVST